MRYDWTGKKARLQLENRLLIAAALLLVAACALLLPARFF